MKTIKKVEVEEPEDETDEQRQSRLKMEQLDRLRTNGPALR